MEAKTWQETIMTPSKLRAYCLDRGILDPNEANLRVTRAEISWKARDAEVKETEKKV